MTVTRMARALLPLAVREHWPFILAWCCLAAAYAATTVWLFRRDNPCR
jgi:hypothetical protein